MAKNENNSELGKNVAEKDLSYHSYEDAIELAGHGKYNIGLLFALISVMTAMGIDLLGFTVVVSGSMCDLRLTLTQAGFLVSVPFIGPIITSYMWGYISDTKGRRKSLIVAMFTSFIISTITSFSPNWIVLALFKLTATSLSSCAQSVTYALLSESCVARVRGPYMLLMTSMLLLTPCIYFIIGYFVLKMDFFYDLGYINFTPWRLLSLILALPMFVGAVSLTFFYESPKFLLNAGREDEALRILTEIWKRNGSVGGKYPVQKLVLLEDGNIKKKDMPILQSLWVQIAPLFKPPVLYRTLQLFFLTAVIYGTNNSFLMWFPFLANAFFTDTSSDMDRQGLCNSIANVNTTRTTSVEDCQSSLALATTLSSVVQSGLCAIINMLIARFAARKKIMMITIILLTFICCLGITIIQNNAVSFAMFVGILFICLCMGIVFSYFIDLYPTSHRGMMACLGVMVARGSALAATNLVGATITKHCYGIFYGWSALLFSGVVLACFLPSDLRKT